MKWEYKIVDKTEESGEPWFALCEVYYNDDGSVMGMSEVRSVGSESSMGVGAVLRAMLRDTNRQYAPLKWQGSGTVSGY